MNSIIGTLTNILYIIPEFIILVALFFLLQKYKHISVWMMVFGTALRIIGSFIQFNINIQSMEQEGRSFAEIEIYFRILQVVFVISNFLFAIGLLIFILYLTKNKENLHS